MGKKRCLIIVIGLIMVMSSVWMVKDCSFAALPPHIYPDPYNVYTITVSKGQTAELKYQWLPQFDNERVDLEIYDANRNLVATGSQQFYNYGYPELTRRYCTITWDTTNLQEGTYTVKTKMMFYSNYAWNEAPNMLTTYVVVTGRNKSGDNNTNKKNGWKKENNTWYYYTNGAVSTGWKKVDGEYYYFDTSGAMLKGWQQIYGSWYYLNGGKMATGWKKIAGNWYYFGTNGKMATKWKKIGGSWYYFGNNGKMVTGWKKMNGNWYYFDSGKMVTGTKTIGGKKYKFSSEGKMIS